MRAALALAIVAHALFLLAVVGQLRLIPMLVVVAAGIVASYRLPVASCPPRATGNWQLATLLALLPLALFPPLAFDETLYHLPFIRALATSGRLHFMADMRFPVFPQLHELLCVPVFAIFGDTATHLVSLLELAVLAMLLVEWSGWLAAALLLGSPIVLHLGTITYVELALALFVAAGFYCLDRRRLALSGFFFGTACSVKYLGGYFAVAALVIAALAYRREAIRFAAACLAAALPTTLWLVANTGNPVFPFFGHSSWAMPLPPPTLGTRLIWDVTFARERVNMQPPVTPLLVLMIAAVLVAAVRDVRARIVIAICAVYVAAFSFLPQDSRYLVPLLPLLSVVAAARFPRFPIWLALAPGVLYLGYRLAVNGLPLDREAILAKRIPEYTALRRADDQRVYVCGGEQLKYYARGQLLGDFTGPYAYDRVLAGDVAANLRRIDARWLLVAKRVCPPRLPQSGMELVYEDAAAQLWRLIGARTSGPQALDLWSGARSSVVRPEVARQRTRGPRADQASSPQAR